MKEMTINKNDTASFNDPNSKYPSDKGNKATNGNLVPTHHPSPDGWINHATDLTSICAVVAVAALGFGLLTIVAGPNLTVTENWLFWPVLGTTLLISLIGLFGFARGAVQYNEITQPKGNYVLTELSLMTLKAAGLPDDLTGCLHNILMKAEKLSPSKKELSIRDRNPRLQGTWIGDLEHELGKIRVKEFEEIIFRYTYREAD